MSAGSVSLSSHTSSLVIKDQLIEAIRTRDLESIREILLQVDENGRSVVKDSDIHEALSEAAQKGIVECCRLLWGKLSRFGKQKYFAETISSIFDSAPLYAAVRFGHFEVVRLFIKEFKFNINQNNSVYTYKTPLCYAVDNLEIAQFLLENEAIVNSEGKVGPLCLAVKANNTEVCHLLLTQYQANPNTTHQHLPRNTDHAIIRGNADILRMLLEHGAFVGGHHGIARTSLNDLLWKQDKSRETKLTICRILIEHAKQDHATASFMRTSFLMAIKSTDNNESCHILLDSGLDLRKSMYWAIGARNLSICQLLVREYRVDPFLQEENNDNDETAAAASPFLATARFSDTSLFEYFLRIWDERFVVPSSTSGGKNNNGDYPIHVVCCDPHVSLQAIKVLVNRNADALAVVDGEQGLLPFHLAASWGATLNVILYLLQHNPNALCHGGNSAAFATTADACPSLPNAGTIGSLNDFVESSNQDNKQQNDRGPAKKKAKTRHSS